MLRMKVVVVMLLAFMVLGMAAAETYGEAVERMLREIDVVYKRLDFISSWLFWISAAFFVVAIIYFAWLQSHGMDIGQNQGLMKRLEASMSQNKELWSKVDILSQQNLDLINRHEELIKLLLSKMGTQAPTQNIVVQQQPKPLAKPTREIVEINPNSPADQAWLAKQKKKQG